ADADGERRDTRFTLLHHVEMRIEGRGLKHFGERQLHLVGERHEMRRRNLVISVLDQVEMLDQKIAPAWPVAEQCLDFVRGGRIDLAAFWRCFRPPAALARMFERANLVNVVTHGIVSSARIWAASPTRSILLYMHDF